MGYNNGLSLSLSLSLSLGWPIFGRRLSVRRREGKGKRDSPKEAFFFSLFVAFSILLCFYVYYCVVVPCEIQRGSLSSLSHLSNKPLLFLPTPSNRPLHARGREKLLLLRPPPSPVPPGSIMHRSKRRKEKGGEVHRNFLLFHSKIWVARATTATAQVGGKYSPGISNLQSPHSSHDTHGEKKFRDETKSFFS